MPSNPKQDLDAALSAALAQYTETMGEAFPTVPKLDLVDDPDVWASVEMQGSDLVIEITTGLVTAVTELWSAAYADEEFVAGITTPMPGSAEEMSRLSLVWLMLHEMHHYQMGHFDVLDRFRLTEAKDPNRFGVVARASTMRPPLLADIEDDDLPKVEPCLEMQSDHDALEMLLDAYSAEGWDIIRTRTAAISGMMTLIEREDMRRDHALSSHPKAATRMFQLLGHVIEMPMIQAKLAAQYPDLHIAPAVPSDAEQSAFNREVVIPAFFDAVHLARIADVDTIREDLGEPQDFFRDVQIAKLEDADQFDALTTEGAVQWAELIGVNGKLLPLVQPWTAINSSDMR